MWVRPLVGMVVALAVSGCGRASGGVSTLAADRLQPQVQAVRQAAAEGHADVAGDELAALRAMVAELSAAGEVSEDGVGRILAAADEVESELALLDRHGGDGASPGPEPAPTTEVTTPSTVVPETTSAPTTDAEDNKKDEEKKAKEEQKKKAKSGETDSSTDPAVGEGQAGA